MTSLRVHQLRRWSTGKNGSDGSVVFYWLPAKSRRSRVDYSIICVRRIAPDGPLNQVIRPSAPLISADPFNRLGPSADPAAANTNLMGRHCNHKSHLVTQVTAAAAASDPEENDSSCGTSRWMSFEIGDCCVTNIRFEPFLSVCLTELESRFRQSHPDSRMASPAGTAPMDSKSTPAAGPSKWPRFETHAARQTHVQCGTSWKHRFKSST